MGYKSATHQLVIAGGNLNLRLQRRLAQACYVHEADWCCAVAVGSRARRGGANWSNGCNTLDTKTLYYYRRSLVLELQTTRELLASSLKKVQDLELESGKVPALQSRIHELERNLGKPNNTRYVTAAARDGDPTPRTGRD